MLAQSKLPPDLESEPNETTKSASPASVRVLETVSSPRKRVRARRRGVRVFALLVGISLISAGLGWLAARGIKSPADVAARTAPPLASRITAQVELRELRSELNRRGNIRFGAPRIVTLPASLLKPGIMIMTSPPVKGASLEEGGIAGEVSGRPVMVLRGPRPMYRDIRPGDEGDDVVDLKAALTRLGFAPGSGRVFDAPAQAAVSRWLATKGFPAFGTSDAQKDKLKLLDDAVGKAGDAVRSAELALSKSSDGVPRDKVLSADEQIRLAKQRVVSERDSASISSQQNDLLIEKKKLAVDTAQAAVADAEFALQRTSTDMSDQLSLEDAQLGVTSASQRVQEVKDQIAKANDAVSDAKAAADTARFALSDAQDAAADAANNVTLADDELRRQKDRTAPQQIQSSDGAYTSDEDAKSAFVRNAEDGVVRANANLRTANASARSAKRALDLARKANQSDLSVEQGALDDANAAVSDAQRAVTEAQDEVTRQKEKEAPKVPATRATVYDESQKATLVHNAEVQLSAAKSAERNAQIAVRNAQSASDKATAAIATATRAVDSLSPVLGTATQQLRVANLRLSSAKQEPGGGGVITRRTPEQLQRDLQSARSNLELATKDYRQTLGNTTGSKGSAAAIEAAEAQLLIAQSQREAIDKPVDIEQLKVNVDAAKRGQLNARRDLSDFQKSLGISVPANEVLFFDSLPLRVEESKLVAGDPLQAIFMTVSSPTLSVDSNVDATDSPSVHEGMPAEIELTDYNAIVPAVVSEVGKEPGTDNVEASKVYVRLTPDESRVRSIDTGATSSLVKIPALRDLNGQSVRVIIPISSTGGKVLVVPTAALSGTVNGTPRVEVQNAADNSTKYVLVNAGLKAEGFVQVTPRIEGSLREGDEVVTGNRDETLIEGQADANDKPDPNAEKITPSSSVDAAPPPT